MESLLKERPEVEGIVARLDKCILESNPNVLEKAIHMVSVLLDSAEEGTL